MPGQAVLVSSARNVVSFCLLHPLATITAITPEAPTAASSLTLTLMLMRWAKTKVDPSC